jgi:hypothetical protein
MTNEIIVTYVSPSIMAMRNSFNMAFPVERKACVFRDLLDRLDKAECKK